MAQKLYPYLEEQTVKELRYFLIKQYGTAGDVFGDGFGASPEHP
jgi:hypothetical protein